MTAIPRTRRKPVAPTRRPRLPHRPIRSRAAGRNDYVPGTYDGPLDDDARNEKARFLATGGPTVPPMYRRNPGACLVLIHKAQALNIPIADAFDGIYWNDGLGKGAMTSQLAAWLLKRAGYRFKTVTETSERVEIDFWGPDGRKLGRVRWTIAEAIAAGIASRYMWQVYPSDMLWARALMRGVRRFAQELGPGLAYTQEELGDMTGPADAAAEPVDADVQEYVDEAATTGTTAADIKNDITARARKAKLLSQHAGGGRTLGEVLTEMYGVARAREADQLARQPQAEPEGDARPAGTGALECGCDAAELAATGDHQRGCTRA